MTEQNTAHIFDVLRHYGDICVMEAAVKKEADVACLVVLDKDIFTIPTNEMHTIDPVCTWFDGQELHFPNPLKA